MSISQDFINGINQNLQRKTGCAAVPAGPFELSTLLYVLEVLPDPSLALQHFGHQPLTLYDGQTDDGPCGPFFRCTPASTYWKIETKFLIPQIEGEFEHRILRPSRGIHGVTLFRILNECGRIPKVVSFGNQIEASIPMYEEGPCTKRIDQPLDKPAFQTVILNRVKGNRWLIDASLLLPAEFCR